jgi:glycosyltransferase involved in cell wall biosynthesis
MSPAVSIILPTFNRLKYLPATVTSVFDQTCKDWELIIADDGSGAETKAYLQTLAQDPRVKLLWLTHIGKPAAVRNIALREARGEYVAFQDSDDLWQPRKLEVQLASLAKAAGRRWSHTNFVIVDASGRPKTGTSADGWPAAGGWILEKLLTMETSIALPGVVVSRALVEQVGGFDEDLVMCEDYELWLRLAAQSEIDAIDEPLTLVRRHSEHSGDDVTAFVDCLKALEKVLRWPNAGPLVPRVRRQRAKVWAALAKSRAASGNRLGVLSALLSSAHLSWRYPIWWRGGLEAMGRAFAPAGLRKAVRRLLNGRRVESRA